MELIMETQMPAPILQELADSGLPAQFTTPWGQTLVAVGLGKYPYDCPLKDKYPNAMIYGGPGCWSTEHCSEFVNRVSKEGE
jgi:hypothetical protein